MQDLITESQPDTISYLSWETMNATSGSWAYEQEILTS
jgi:hypothetical protein